MVHMDKTIPTPIFVMSALLGIIVFHGGVQAADQLEANASATLEGTAWAVEVIPEGTSPAGEKTFNDVLVFEEGKMNTSVWNEHGFLPSSYMLSSAGGGGWAFSAEQISNTEGRTLWQGGIVDEHMKGRLVWWKKNGQIVTYSFEGEQQGTQARKQNAF